MIPPVLSVYLDLLRFLAASSVMLSHLWRMAFPGAPVIWPGHEPVILFFVLSGTMMAYVTDRGRGDLRGYVLDRLARLWSVAVPALLLGGGLALVVGDWVELEHPSVAAPPRDAGWADVAWRSVVSLLFLGESSLGLGGVLAPNNGPYWSLNYEAMYYWIFGAWAFLRGPWRWIAVTGLALLAGPRILALMPCWLIGVLVYRWQGRIVLPRAVAQALVFATLAVIWWSFAWGIGQAIYATLREFLPLYRLRFSNWVVEDTLLAVLVAVNFLAVAAGGVPSALLRLSGPIRRAAACTLTIYLFHVPLAFIAAGLLGLGGWALVAAVALPMAPIAWLTEQRRGVWRRALERLVPATRRRAVS